MFDAIIIGAGCAGLSCALWLHSLNRRVLVLEQTATLGGVATRNTFPITNVLGQSLQGESLRAAYQHQLNLAQIPVLYQCVLHRLETQAHAWLVQTDHANQRHTFHTRHVVLASGSRPRACSLPTPAHYWIHDPLDPRLRHCFGQRVAIFGGGDNALENALALHRQDNQVSVYTRGSFRARSDFLAKAHQQGVALYPESPLHQVTLESPFTLQAGRHQHIADWGMSFWGFVGNSDVFNTCCPTPLQTSTDGFVNTDTLGRTNLPRVFAIGDVVLQPYPCIPTALAHGAMVAKIIAEERFIS